MQKVSGTEGELYPGYEIKFSILEFYSINHREII